MAAIQVTGQSFTCCIKCNRRKAQWDKHTKCFECRDCNAGNTCEICEGWSDKRWQSVKKSITDLKSNQKRKAKSPRKASLTEDKQVCVTPDKDSSVQVPLQDSARPAFGWRITPAVVEHQDLAAVDENGEPLDYEHGHSDVEMEGGSDSDTVTVTGVDLCLVNTGDELVFFLPNGQKYQVPYEASDGEVDIPVTDLLHVIAIVQRTKAVKVTKPPGTPKPRPVRIKNRFDPLVSEDNVAYLLPREDNTSEQIRDYLRAPEVKMARPFPKVPPSSFMFSQPDTPVKAAGPSAAFCTMSKTDYVSNPLPPAAKCSVPLSLIDALTTAAITIMSANDFNTLCTATIVDLGRARSLPRQNVDAVDRIISAIQDLQAGCLSAVMSHSCFQIAALTIVKRDTYLEHMKSEVSKQNVTELRHGDWDPNSLFGASEQQVKKEYDETVKRRSSELNINQMSRPAKFVVNLPATSKSGNSYVASAKRVQVSDNQSTSKKRKGSSSFDKKDNKKMSASAPAGEASASFKPATGGSKKPFYAGRGGRGGRGKKAHQ